jgi:hypothetical protein
MKYEKHIGVTHLPRKYLNFTGNLDEKITHFVVFVKRSYA